MKGGVKACWTLAFRQVKPTAITDDDWIPVPECSLPDRDATSCQIVAWKLWACLLLCRDAAKLYYDLLLRWACKATRAMISGSKRPASMTPATVRELRVSADAQVQEEPSMCGASCTIDPLLQGPYLLEENSFTTLADS